MTGSGTPGDAQNGDHSSRRSRIRPEPTPLQRAIGLLARREHSKKELARKLIMRGIDVATATEAIDKAAVHGWQDDARFSESLLRNRMAQGYGPLYIRAELATHGLEAAHISALLDGVADEWGDIARHLIYRRFGDICRVEPAAKRKAADLLLRRGFTREQMRSVMASDAVDD